MTEQQRAQLYGALHMFVDAEVRWDQRRKNGLTNKGLRDAVASEFGSMGGRAGDEGHYTFRGGSNPAIWFDICGEHGPPSLTGCALLAAVREVMQIPLPGQSYATQLCLFA